MQYKSSAAALLLLLAGCDGGLFAVRRTEPCVSIASMPDRAGVANTRTVTSALHTNGGGVFVVLTAPPSAEALTTLAAAGLTPPDGHETIVRFASLLPTTVWGAIPPDGVREVVGLCFVTLVEPSDLGVPIGST